MRNKIDEVNPDTMVKLENTVLFIFGYSPEKKAIDPILRSHANLNSLYML
ncbi:hypothetical protein QUA04_27920 [Microcoleus sp. S13_C5]